MIKSLSTLRLLIGMPYRCSDKAGAYRKGFFKGLFQVIVSQYKNLKK